MLRYFRINDPYRLVGLLVISFIIYLPFFIDAIPVGVLELKSLLIGEKIHSGLLPYTDLVDSTPPLTCWVFGLIDMVFGKSLLARHVLSYLIIFSLGAYLATLFIDKKVLAENTYLPALLFVILHIFSYDTLVLSGELMGSAFILFALSNIFRELEFRSQRLETVLYIGIHISIASLFSFSFVVFLPAACLIMIVYARRDFSSFLLLIVGFCLPHLLLICFYFVFEEPSTIWKFFYAPNLAIQSQILVSPKAILFLGAIPLFYMLLALIVLNRDARFTRYQSQLFQIMFLWMLFSVLQAFYTKNFRPQSFIVLVPTLTFFISHFLLFIRRRRYAEMNLWILLLGVLTVSIMGRYNLLIGVPYGHMVVNNSQKAIDVSDKRVLVLEDELSYFINNQLATPFLQWSLCAEIFTQPDHYENVIKVNSDFKNDPPEIIIDPHHYMDGFFDRIPTLKAQYKSERAGVYTRQIH